MSFLKIKKTKNICSYVHMMSYALLVARVLFWIWFAGFVGGYVLMQSLELYCVVGCKNLFKSMGMTVESWILCLRLDIGFLWE